MCACEISHSYIFTPYLVVQRDMPQSVTNHIIFFWLLCFLLYLFRKRRYSHTHTHTHFEVAFLMFPIWRSSKQLITQFLCCSKKNSCKTSAEQVLAEAVEIFHFSHAKRCDIMNHIFTVILYILLHFYTLEGMLHVRFPQADVSSFECVSKC